MLLSQEVMRFATREHILLIRMYVGVAIYQREKEIERELKTMRSRIATRHGTVATRHQICASQNSSYRLFLATRFFNDDVEKNMLHTPSYFLYFA